MRFRALGANQRVCSHCCTPACALFLETLAGSTPSGAINGSADFGCPTMGAPQNEQLPATCGGTKATTLPHPWQCISCAFAAICTCPELLLSVSR